LSTSRTRPTRKGWHYDGSEAVLDERGKRTCRWCRGTLSGRRTSFCSDACVHQWKLRTQPGYLRDLVFERDKGVCALCGLDTEAEIVEAVRACGFRHRSFWGRAEVQLYLKRRGVVTHPHRLSLWDADHITPVSEGGGECDLDNLRTLCLMCHGAVTRMLAKERAKKARGVTSS